MIDFVKLKYQDRDKFENFALNNENFKKLYMEYEYHSETLSYPIKIPYQKMDIRINEKSAYLKNSIHKMSNYLNSRGVQNYNDFNYESLCKSIDYLENNIPNTGSAKITQLEFGLNIKTQIPAKMIINNSIAFHKYKVHNKNFDFKGKGQYKQFNYSNFFIKIYDKALQYKLNENILRIEIKYINSKEINKMGIFQLSDLKDKQKLKLLFNDLLKRFDELTIVDEVEDELPLKEKQQLEKFLSFNYWDKLSLRNNRNLKMKEKKAFEKLLEKNNLLKTKTFLRNKIIEKFTELIEN